MSKKYVIQWKSNVNGRAGRGTKLFEHADAEQLVAELNREYPQIHHEAVEEQGAGIHSRRESEPRTPELTFA